MNGSIERRITRLEAGLKPDTLFRVIFADPGQDAEAAREAAGFGPDVDCLLVRFVRAVSDTK